MSRVAIGFVLVHCTASCLFCIAGANSAWAVPFDARFIKVDVNGPTGQIDDVEEARRIVKGNLDGAVFEEEVFGSVQVLDLAGGGGNFDVDMPYLNGVNDDSMDDFLQYMQANTDFEIPEGDWTIGFGSDDGGYIRMPSISFSATFNENGNTTDGDGEILYNAPRGHGWTTGQFTVPAGGIRTGFEAIFFERGGGDSFEVAITSGCSDATDGATIGATWSLLEDGAKGWRMVHVDYFPGDFNRDGLIDHSDAQIMADNFGTGTTHEHGDYNRDGRVDLQDFVDFREILNSQGFTAAVPEPSSFPLLLGSLAGVLMMRRRLVNSHRRRFAACSVASCLFSIVVANSAWAELFEGRFIKVDVSGPTGQIDDVEEARRIVKGNLDGAVFAEEVFGSVQVLDLAGGNGNFDVDMPYLNGVNDDSMDDFLQWHAAVLDIPAGEWTIGFGSDDGGYIRMPAISFEATFNENGDTTEGDGEILYNAPRGHAWTTGQFTVPAGGILTDFEAMFHERGGGDSFEVAIFPGFSDTTEGTRIGAEWKLLEDGAEGWIVVDTGHGPFDFNFDGAIDLLDAGILADNFGTGTTFEQGDNNQDGRVDLRDFVQFREVFNGLSATAAVPEPSSIVLVFGSVVGLLTMRRQRRT